MIIFRIGIAIQKKKRNKFFKKYSKNLPTDILNHYILFNMLDYIFSASVAANKLAVNFTYIQGVFITLQTPQDSLIKLLTLCIKLSACTTLVFVNTYQFSKLL